MNHWGKITIVIMVLVLIAIAGINIFSHTSEPQIMAPGPYVQTQSA